MDPLNPPPAGADPAVAAQMRIMQQRADTTADMHTDAAGTPRDAPREGGDAPGAKGATTTSTAASTTTTSSTLGQASRVHEPQATDIRQLSASSTR
jgi:uncharacterized protein involved in outer membrane biogenesis